jgi:type III pantothenate kinase
VIPDIVVDIGNTRIKWGWRSGNEIQTASLPPDDEGAWDRQLSQLRTSGSIRWAIASVHPTRLERFLTWGRARGEPCQVIDHSHIPLAIDVAEPRRVGIDRILNALAARRRCPGETPIVVIDAGSAVTVDFLDERNVFRGGAILPGPHLMARALHQYTALLPELPIHAIPSSDAPGRSTPEAMTLGIRAALVGGCALLVEQYSTLSSHTPSVYITGGAIGAFSDFVFPSGKRALGPFPLTLEGIWIAAERVS